MPPKEHYRLYGAKEGRISHINQEFDIIRDKINSLNLSILELGPFDNPRFSGHNVKYMDVLDQAELEDRKKKYKRKKKVPIIDYVCRDGRLGSINEKFDIVFSAHCIEHNISLIDHLNDVYKILNESGVYIAIIPDKRYCFDFNIPETTISDIIDNYYKKEDVPIKELVNYYALSSHNDPIRHWNGDHEYECNKICGIKKAVDLHLKNELEFSKFTFHRLRTYPSKFKEIVSQIYALNYIKMKPSVIYGTLKNRFDFLAILERG